MSWTRWTDHMSRGDAGMCLCLRSFIPTLLGADACSLKLFTSAPGLHSPMRNLLIICIFKTIFESYNYIMGNQISIFASQIVPRAALAWVFVRRSPGVHLGFPRGKAHTVRDSHILTFITFSGASPGSSGLRCATHK